MYQTLFTAIFQLLNIISIFAKSNITLVLFDKLSCLPMAVCNPHLHLMRTNAVAGQRAAIVGLDDGYTGLGRAGQVHWPRAITCMLRDELTRLHVAVRVESRLDADCKRRTL